MGVVASGWSTGSGSGLRLRRSLRGRLHAEALGPLPLLPPLPFPVGGLTMGGPAGTVLGRHVAHVAVTVATRVGMICGVPGVDEAKMS